MTEANTARVERQKKTPITVIIGNPPYNVGQLNENDNNKNRKYAVIDKRIKIPSAIPSAIPSVRPSSKIAWYVEDSFMETTPRNNCDAIAGE